MKLNAMVLAALMLSPLMLKAQPTVIEPLTNEERGEVAVWVDSLDRHERGDRDGRRDDRRERPKQKECPGLTLDDTQKAALKTAMFTFTKDMNIAKAETKNAMMDYGMTLSDAASTREQGVTSGTALKDAFNKMGDLKMNFEIGVFYDILKPEQREPAMKCAMEHMKDMMKKKLEKLCKDMKKD